MPIRPMSRGTRSVVVAGRSLHRDLQYNLSSSISSSVHLRNGNQ